MQEQKKYNLADGNIRKHFVTYKQAAELYSMGMNRIQEHAKAAGATYKMGNERVKIHAAGKRCKSLFLHISFSFLLPSFIYWLLSFIWSQK